MNLYTELCYLWNLFIQSLHKKHLSPVCNSSGMEISLEFIHIFMKINIFRKKFRIIIYGINDHPEKIIVVKF